MTPKQKAEELLDKMYYTEHCGIEHFPNKNYCDCVGMNYYQAKECALIAVDEILEALLTLFSEMSPYVIYWQEVKQEIKKL
jgi:hypothetical protein